MQGQIVVTSTSSVESEDRIFNGTSSACPIAAGLIAAKLQYNRDWTYADVKNWISSNVESTTTSYFYSGTEATTATDSNWTDTYNLQGAPLKIMYDAALDAPPLSGDFTSRFVGSNLILSGAFSMKATPPTPQINTTNLILHLDAGNSSSYSGSGTTWTDLSGEGNDVTLVNGPTYSSNDGGYFDFDGTNDYINANSALPDSFFQGNSTISFWIYFNTVDSDSQGTSSFTSWFKLSL